MYADFIDGKEVMIIGDNRTAPNEKKRVISGSDDGTIFTSCLNCGAMVQQVIGRKPKKYCSDKCRYAFWHKKNDDNPNFGAYL